MTAPTTTTRDEGGFALLVLIGLVGMASVGILLAVQRFVPPLADVPVRAVAGLERARTLARDAFVADGAFPADLTALAATGGAPADDGWRRDPWASPADLDYAVTATGARTRTRGPDRTLGTADDDTGVALAEPLLRVRQRGRLRLQRALFAASTFCTVPAMSPAERSAMVAALRDYAVARRAWLAADATERTNLTTRLTTATSTVQGLRSLHLCAALPTFLVGPGGLMERLGMPDALCVDGRNAPLVRDDTVGVVAVGWDVTGGTDDDM